MSVVAIDITDRKRLEQDPLAPMKSALHILSRTGAPSGTTTEMLDVLKRSCSQTLVQDLVDLSSAERAQPGLRLEEVNVAQLLNAATGAVQALGQARGQSLRVEPRQ